MFRQFAQRASRIPLRGKVGRSLALTTGVTFATAGVAFAHSAPEKISVADVQSGVVQLSDRDFEAPSPALLEQDGQNQSAYDPVTGQINWDCPCLGGMAHGPCGPEFKEAFACFIYSTEEVKGSECIPKFSAMQNCFRQYPEIYAEYQDDADVADGPTGAGAGAAATEAKEAAASGIEDVKASVESTKEAASTKISEAKTATKAKADTVAANLERAGEALKDEASSLKDSASQPLQNATEFASAAAEGIAAEAKDAANFVAQGIQDTLGKRK